jgi:RNA polymerase sigma-70 factor (ECF subfamily)
MSVDERVRIDRSDRVETAAATSRPMTDEQLLCAYRGGQREAFAELVHRYQRDLYRFLTRYLGEGNGADDVFQEAFLQIHQSAATFDARRRFRPWLFAIAVNKARDRLRARARHAAVLPLEASFGPGAEEAANLIELVAAPGDAPGDPLEKEELRRRVYDVILAMPEHLREILLLAYFHRFPYKQIASILDIPLGTVKSRLHAALAGFAVRWQAVHGPDGDASPETAHDCPLSDAAMEPPADLVGRTVARLPD